MIEYGGFQTNPHFTEYERDFADLTPLEDPRHDVVETLVLVLRERLQTNLFMDGPLHTNRSHCTYSIALSMREAANVFKLHCLYEEHNRFDGVIQTPGDDPFPVLYAEWEWNYGDIFKEGQELAKLWSSVSRSKTADALLITYCERSEYKDFARKVIQWWKAKYKQNTNPVLYFLTIVFKMVGIDRSPVCLRTMVIEADKVQFWDDVLQDEE